jgi:CysZ protein
MGFISGITYNLRGLKLAFRTPKLLLLGLVRFFAVVLLTTLSAGLVLFYHQDILNLMWQRPEGTWLVWLWFALSWLVALVLAAVSVILSYLAAQLLFAVWVMDAMSRITERLATGRVQAPESLHPIGQFFFLVRQEIPRAVIPVLAALLLMGLGWLTPLGPLVTAVASVLAVIFLSWDNTDLVAARRMEPFSRRFRFLLQTLPFHLGFGLLFLIPVLNILLLSFAPVGATLFCIENRSR